MLSDEHGRDPTLMAAALRGMATQQRPSDAVIPGLLDGLDRIHDLTEVWLEDEIEPRRFALA
jgi:hypothetical protein